MKFRSFFVAVVAAAMFSVPALHAQNNPASGGGEQQVYGWQLMTVQERNEFRDRMRNAKTVEERRRIQAEHHAQMQARARERGVTLPDQPMRQPGAGMGQGGGMGPGGGRGPGR